MAPSRSGSLFALAFAALAAVVGLLAWSAQRRSPEPPRPSAAPDARPTATTGSGAAVPARASTTDPADGRRTAAAAGPIAVTGVVRGLRDAPVAAALVRIDGARCDYEARTDAQGRFAVDDVLPGSYRVTALGPHLLTHTESVDVAAGMPPLVLVVDRGAQLTGRVVDDLRRPVVGARVTPWRPDPAGGEQPDPRCAVTTGPRGHFELRGEQDEGTFVLVEHPTFVAAKTRLRPGRPRVVALHADR